MGILSKAARSVVGSTRTLASTIPTWHDQQPQVMPQSYDRYLREGYQRNELVYACVEQLATSAAEPRIAAYQKTGAGKEPKEVEDHPILDLLERPNPFMSRSLFWQTVMLHRAIAGNVFIEKARNRLGVSELWLWRPDRVKIIPDKDKYIGGYQVQVGSDVFTIDARDMIHIRTRNTLDDYYGMPPIQAASSRIDTDNYMREFVRQFFINAGIPAGLITLEQTLNAQERETMRARFRQDYAGPSGWHNLMIIDGGKGTYTPMGQPLGDRGLAMGDLDDINASRICAVFGVPVSIVGAKLGMASSSYANRIADMGVFWQVTLVPIYREFAASLTSGLVPEFDGVDYVEFDLSDVKALEEDRNEFHDRVRKDMAAGMIGREQARKLLGYQDPDPDDVYLVPVSMTPEPVTPIEEPPPTALPAATVSAPPQLTAGQPLPNLPGRTMPAGQQGQANVSGTGAGEGTTQA